MKERIFAPLGMEDIAFSLTPSMRSRLAVIHQREADGSLTPLVVAAERGNQYEPPSRFCCVSQSDKVFGVDPEVLRFNWLRDALKLFPIPFSEGSRRSSADCVCMTGSEVALRQPPFRDVVFSIAPSCRALPQRYRTKASFGERSQPRPRSR